MHGNQCELLLGTKFPWFHWSDNSISDLKESTNNSKIDLKVCTTFRKTQTVKKWLLQNVTIEYSAYENIWFHNYMNYVAKYIQGNLN